MGIKDKIIEKFVPEKFRAYKEPIEELLRDKAIVADLVIILEEVKKELKIASENPDADQSLKDAFNNAAIIIPAGKAFVENSMTKLALQGPKVISNKDNITNSFKTMGEAYKAKNPAMIAFDNAVRKNNPTTKEALKRLAAKTSGKLFLLEDGEDGKGYGILTLTGMRIPFEKEDYAEIKATIQQSQQPPKPPTP